MAAQRANNGRTKPAETQTNAPAPEAAPPAPPIPAKGVGPLAGYPVPAGATHWRLHAVDGSGKIGGAITLALDAEGEPITRAPVALLGDARWWDALPGPGALVRVVFARMNGDVVIGRLGQGPLWTPKGQRERTAEGVPVEAPPAPPANPVLASEAGSLFTVLLQLQDMADRRAKAEVAAVREAAQQQRQADRDFMRSMTELSLGARREERRDDERRAARAAQSVAEAARAAVLELRDADADDEAADEAEADDVKEKADVIGQALAGLGGSLKPILEELGKRAVAGALPGSGS